MHSPCPAGSPGAVCPITSSAGGILSVLLQQVRALEHRIRRDGKKTHESRRRHHGFHCEATD